MKCTFCNNETNTLTKHVPTCRDCRHVIKIQRDIMIVKKAQLFEAAYGIESSNDPGPIKEYLKAFDGTLRTAMMLMKTEKEEPKEMKIEQENNRF